MIFFNHGIGAWCFEQDPVCVPNNEQDGKNDQERVLVFGALVQDHGAKHKHGEETAGLVGYGAECFHDMF